MMCMVYTCVVISKRAASTYQWHVNPIDSSKFQTLLGLNTRTGGAVLSVTVCLSIPYIFWATCACVNDLGNCKCVFVKLLTVMHASRVINVRGSLQANSRASDCSDPLTVVIFCRSRRLHNEHVTQLWVYCCMLHATCYDITFELIVCFPVWNSRCFSLQSASWLDRTYRRSQQYRDLAWLHPVVLLPRAGSSIGRLKDQLGRAFLVSYALCTCKLSTCLLSISRGAMGNTSCRVPWWYVRSLRLITDTHHVVL